MKHHRRVWLVVLLVGLVVMGSPPQTSHAGVQPGWGSEQAAQTPSPTDSAASPDIATPDPRQLPPVGGNAGLVIAGSVLVLIILGGVMFSSRRNRKH